MVSWRFFSAKADYDFVEWDFSGHGENSNADEAATLFGILEGTWAREVYMAVYDQLGAVACRILVPGYSEVYPVEDLIWDNTNKALAFRADILNLHRLDDAAGSPARTPGRGELDDYTDIITLIGIEFDENTVWGQLTILELKLLINLALKQFEEAQDLRRRLPAIQREHRRARPVLPGPERGAGGGARRRAGTGRLRGQLPPHVRRRAHGRGDRLGGGSVRFHGLTPTSMKLEGLDRQGAGARGGVSA